MSDNLDLGVTSALILPTPRATPAELLALAQGRAPDPSAFDGALPFFYSAEISSTRLDAYFGHMHQSTLRNFATDASAGVAVLVAHDSWRALPIGQSLTGQFLPAQGDQPARVVADFFLIPGLTTTGQMSSDEVITRIRTGVQRDKSVGFNLAPRADGTRGRYVCDICGGNLMDYRACPHWPGLEYEYTDSATGQSSLRLATFTVFDAGLSEVSPVYDGATPGAVVLKARASNSEGLTDRQIALLEQRYRTRLPARPIRSGGITVPPATDPAPRAPTEVRDPAAPDHQEPTMDLIARLRQTLGIAEGDPDDALLPAAQTLSSLLAELRQALGLADDADPLAHARQLGGELPALRRQAEEGRAYRDELTAAALAEAVRAFGAAAEAQNAPVLAPLSLEQIRQMRDSWRTIADARLPGGRITIDSAEGRETPTGEPGALPARIYQH